MIIELKLQIEDYCIKWYEWDKKEIAKFQFDNYE